MTQIEQKTVQQIDQKLDDLSDRFDRFIATLKWSFTAFILLLTAIAGLVLAFKK